MPSAIDRIDFGPPREGRSANAFMLAVLAHLLLLGALTWGVNWKSSEKAASFEAELWSALPQQAAPRLVEPPPPPPAPTPVQPTPQPKAAVEPPKTEPVRPDVDIALEQEKKRKLAQQKKEEEAAELKREKELARKELEKEKAREELAQRKADELKKAEAKKEEAKELAKKQQEDKAAAAAADKRRQENLARLNALAGATGAPDATGSAQRSSGPSSSYNGKVAAKVRPNVVFTEDIVGNPKAEVEVATTADGTIISQRLVKSSGNKAWDDAVIKAIIRTGSMPKDVDGRVPTPMILEFRPRELL
jgi:colicin import membrane protein